MPPKQGKPEQEKSLEATLWEAADRLRSRVDAAEYKHVVLGLIFLKYVSDVFAKRREALERLVDDPAATTSCRATSESGGAGGPRRIHLRRCVLGAGGHRWDDLRKAAKQTDIGEASTRRWTRSRRRTRACGECCRRVTHDAN